MCTAISYNAKEHYFGRNLDVECEYGEKVVITPRNYKFETKNQLDFIKHYAIIGTAVEVKEYPLYFDGVNEYGLCMAGLNFPNNAVYHNTKANKINLTPFEFIPYILGKCKNICEVENLLCKVNIINLKFSDNLPLTPLHWIISDNKKSLTVESVREGLRFYKNDVGVLTNNPPFLKQLENLAEYRGVFFKKQPQNNGSSDYSLGFDGIGIPGDFSSQSRFVKAVFVKQKSSAEIYGKEAVNQFFHILSSVSMPKGCVITASGKHEYTHYSCCFDTQKGDCYYTTYDDFKRIRVSLRDYDLESNKLFSVNIRG